MRVAAKRLPPGAARRLLEHHADRRSIAVPVPFALDARCSSHGAPRLPAAPHAVAEGGSYFAGSNQFVPWVGKPGWEVYVDALSSRGALHAALHRWLIRRGAPQLRALPWPRGGGRRSSRWWMGVGPVALAVMLSSSGNHDACTAGLETDDGGVPLFSSSSSGHGFWPFPPGRSRTGGRSGGPGAAPSSFPRREEEESYNEDGPGEGDGEGAPAGAWGPGRGGGRPVVQLPGAFPLLPALSDQEAYELGLQISIGSVAGFCSGYAVKKVSKLVALAIGVGFIGVQVARYNGVISDVDWKLVEARAIELLDTDGDGRLTHADLRSHFQRGMEILGFNLPSGAAFSAAFLLGLRVG